MRQLSAFIEKEFIEVYRSHKLLIVGLLFFIVGIMNPAMAKLTPWLMNMMADQLANSGIMVNNIEITALTSWEQYFKNMPTVMIVFVLIFSGTVTSELQKGTLINIVTKGMDRWKIIISKACILMLLWSAGYFLCFGVTYFYNDYYWDNSIAQNLMYAVMCMYMLGIWLISLIIFMSSISNNMSGVALGTGAVYLICYFAGLIPLFTDYLPTKLMGCYSLIIGQCNIGDFNFAMIIIGIWSVVDIALGLMLFNKKSI